VLNRPGQTLRLAILLCIILASASSADALCVYGGKHFTGAKDGDSRAPTLYATTTLADEFSDSALVIRGTALSSQGVPTRAEYPEGTIYNIRVDETFKGARLKMLRYFTERNSGMFDPDVGAPFLLFLNRMPSNDEDQKLAPGAFIINYNCGVSRPWAKLTAGDLDQLKSLSKKDR
jgi:hypothetical protein